MPVTRLFRNACITIFGDPPEWDAIKERVKYFAYGEETCPSTGRSHKQAFACGWKPIKFGGWQKLFPGAHIEPMRGQLRENAAYCSKESNLIEFGEKPNENGHKSTLIRYKHLLEKEDRPRAVYHIAKENDDLFPTFLQYRNGLEAYKSFLREEEIFDAGFRPPQLHIRYGVAGLGKSTWIFKEFGYRHVTTMYPYQGGKFFVPPSTGDFVLFDDVQDGQVIPLTLFKTLTDGHPKRVECKGGEVVWNPKVIVITSNHPWRSWWKDMTEWDMAAIQRRITSEVTLTVSI